MIETIKRFLFRKQESIYFHKKDNTDLSYEDRFGSMIESPYKDFEKGDAVSVKPIDEEYRFPKVIGEHIFVRGKNVYHMKEICPKHEVKKFKDEKREERYCPKCE